MGERGGSKERERLAILAVLHLPAPAPFVPLRWTFPFLLTGLEPDHAGDDLGAAAVDGHVAAEGWRPDEPAGGFSSGAQAVDHVI